MSGTRASVVVCVWWVIVYGGVGGVVMSGVCGVGVEVRLGGRERGWDGRWVGERGGMYEVGALEVAEAVILSGHDGRLSECLSYYILVIEDGELHRWLSFDRSIGEGLYKGVGYGLGLKVSRHERVGLCGDMFTDCPEHSKRGSCEDEKSLQGSLELREKVDKEKAGVESGWYRGKNISEDIVILFSWFVYILIAAENGARSTRGWRPMRHIYYGGGGLLVGRREERSLEFSGVSTVSNRAAEEGQN
ncbi:hypothetical protein Tco_0873003 [Tanacetum coccineum]